MKKFVLLLAVLVGGYAYFSGGHSPTQNGTLASATHSSQEESSDAIAKAFASHKSNVQVSGQGIVSKLLADDLNGSRHQKFIVELATGQTVLIAHNIDLAPRVAGLREGDSIQFLGEYEWNEKGGVLHWTHRDPNGSHPSGWLKHQGQTYQ